MKGLLKYDSRYRITEEWVKEFREWLQKDLTIINAGKESYRLQYKSYEWILTNNGLEFNLLFVNLWHHESIPYVRDGKVVSVEWVVVDEILPRIKEDHKLKKQVKLSADKFTEFMMGNRLDEYDSEYLDKFLNETRGRYE